MFHAHDGWYFERLEDGSVHVIKRESAKEKSPIRSEATFTNDEWCSILCFMSGRADMSLAHDEAKRYHNLEG